MRRIAVLVVCISLQYFAVLCPSSAEEKTPRPDVVTVKLLEAGIAPHHELRFLPQQAAIQTSVMTMGMSQAMTVGGQEIPAPDIPVTKITIQSTIDKIEENGDIAFSFSYTHIDVLEDPEKPSPMVAMMKTAMLPMVDTTGHVIVTNRGITQQTELTVPEGVTDQIKKLLDGMKSSLNQLSSPVPLEPVGVGGKWQVVQQLNANGLSLKQTSVHEITKLDPNGFTMNVTLTQTAEPQEIVNATMPPGSKVLLKALESSGNGKTTVDLGSILPSQAQITTTSEMRMTVEVVGQSQDMKVQMKLNMVLEPAK